MPETTIPPSEPAQAREAPSPAPEASAQDLYRASQTFLLRAPDPRVLALRYVTVALVLLLFFVLIPVLTGAGAVKDYKLNLLGKYLCFAIVALGIDLVWGYTGLLSLCQALFFALGGYAMAMHLSLKEGGGDVRPEYNNIPQFMFFNSLHALPAFWKPFASLPVSALAALMVPGAFAGLFGFLILRNRIRGVYFAIITQALAQAAWLLMCRNEMLLGGTNGLTNYSKGWQSPRWIMALYLLTLTILVLAYLFCRALVKSRLGRVLIAVRDKETRLYFAGYKPHAFKVFAFAVGAMLAGLGGMLYPAQVGIITPQDMDVTASIFMVVGVALGGRGKLWGAVFGAVMLNSLRSSLSTDFARLAGRPRTHRRLLRAFPPRRLRGDLGPHGAPDCHGCRLLALGIDGPSPAGRIRVCHVRGPGAHARVPAGFTADHLRHSAQVRPAGRRAGLGGDLRKDRQADRRCTAHGFSVRPSGTTTAAIAGGGA